LQILDLFIYLNPRIETILKKLSDSRRQNPD